MIARRSFLLGLGATLATPAVIRTPGLLMPVRTPPLPRLWGDGLHCDAEAIQALVDGMMVRFRDAVMRPLAGPIVLPEALTYVVRSPVYMPPLRTLKALSPLAVICGPGCCTVTCYADGSTALGAPVPERVA